MMVTYRYRAMDRTGLQTRGVLEASSRSAAAQELRSRGFTVLELREDPDRKERNQDRRRPLFSRVHPREVALFCRRLSSLLRAGVGLAEGLDTLNAIQERGMLKKVLRRMADRIRAGHTLHETMMEHPSVFPAIAPRMAAAAEASGELPGVLDRLAEHLEKRIQLREHLLSVLIYPSIVLVLAIVVLVIMATRLFPTLSGLMVKIHATPPLPMQWMERFFLFCRERGLLLCASLLGLVIVLFLLTRTRGGRYLLDALLLRLPVLGRVLHASATELWTRTLGNLLRSGISLQEGLEVTGELVPNHCFKRALRKARDLVMRGESFGTALDAVKPAADPVACKMVAVGEETGTLEQGLEDVADFAEAELNRRINVIMKLFEPAVIVMVGSLVGVIFYTFFSSAYGFIRTMNQ